MASRTAAAAELETRLGYAFADRSRLECALTHSSAGDGAAAGKTDNERLEFLGDRVIGLLTAERLIALDPAASEGDLAPRLNALVDRPACADAARRMQLGPALRLSGGETRTGGRDKDRILAGAAEAVMAAVYQDGGLEAARAVYDRFWEAAYVALQARGDAPRPKDPKTRLQEWAQSRGRPLPEYRVLGREGPDHAPRFSVEVCVDGYQPIGAEGPSRQLAEKAAATALLQREGMA
jgi:ribonuclease-3